MIPGVMGLRYRETQANASNLKLKGAGKASHHIHFMTRVTEALHCPNTDSGMVTHSLSELLFTHSPSILVIMKPPVRKQPQFSLSLQYPLYLPPIPRLFVLANQQTGRWH